MPAHRANHESDTTPASPSRRRAMKLAAGVGAGTIVWAEPTIRGLATRPAYASAASILEYTANLTMGMGQSLLEGSGITGAQGNTWTLSLTAGGGFGGTISGASVHLSRAGCPCTITSTLGDLAGLSLTLDLGAETVTFTAFSVGADTLTFFFDPPGEIANENPPNSVTGTLSGAAIVSECQTL